MAAIAAENQKGQGATPFALAPGLGGAPTLG